MQRRKFEHDSRPSGLSTRVLSFAKKAAGAGLIGLALAASGCGNGDKYGSETEAALKATIEPPMIKTGKRILDLAAKYPDQTLVSTHKNTVDISVEDSGKALNGDTDLYSSLKVSTSRLGDSDKPNPNGILAISVASSAHLKSESTKRSEHVSLYSPNNGVGISKAGVDGHENGWTAQLKIAELEVVDGEEEMWFQPYLFDTSHIYDFVYNEENDGLYEPTDAVPTANYITNYLSDELLKHTEENLRSLAREGL